MLSNKELLYMWSERLLVGVCVTVIKVERDSYLTHNHKVSEYNVGVAMM